MTLTFTAPLTRPTPATRQISTRRNHRWPASYSHQLGYLQLLDVHGDPRAVRSARLEPFYQIEVVGSGGTAIRDLAGNLLDGSSSGLPGSNYLAEVGQGTKLNYVDQTGNRASLKLSGGGYLQDVIYQGEGQTLTVVGEKPRRTVLRRLEKDKRSSGTTNLGVIRGLGDFGDVRVTLKAPPFLVKQYPFVQNGRGKLDCPAPTAAKR